MLNCYCKLSSSVIFRQYGVSQSECKIDRPRPGLPRVSPRPHTEALGTRLQCISSSILCPCRHFNGSPLLCPINAATSSFSYVFRLQYPRVLHCRIVPIEKLKTLYSCIWKEKPSRKPFRFKIKTNPFESHAQSSRKLLVDT